VVVLSFGRAAFFVAIGFVQAVGRGSTTKRSLARRFHRRKSLRNFVEPPSRIPNFSTINVKPRFEQYVQIGALLNIREPEEIIVLKHKYNLCCFANIYYTICCKKANVYKNV
jgi:hypothetical protein